MKIEQQQGILGRELGTEAAAILGVASNQVRISYDPGKSITIEVKTPEGWGEVPDNKKAPLNAWALSLLQGK